MSVLTPPGSRGRKPGHVDEDTGIPCGLKEETVTGKKLSSKFRGVCLNNKSNKWQAAINVMKRNIYLGSFESEVEAARVFDKACLRVRGAKAKLNFEAKHYLDPDTGDLLHDEHLDKLLEGVMEPFRPIVVKRSRSRSPGPHGATSDTSDGGGRDRPSKRRAGQDGHNADGSPSATLAGLAGLAGLNPQFLAALAAQAAGHGRSQDTSWMEGAHMPILWGADLGGAGGLPGPGAGALALAGSPWAPPETHAAAAMRALTGLPAQPRDLPMHGQRGALPPALQQAEQPQAPLAAQPAAAGGATKGRDLQARDLWSLVQPQLPPDAEMESTVPCTETASTGILFTVQTSPLTGSIVWDGDKLMNLGMYDTFKDAKQAAKATLQTLLHLPRLLARLAVRPAPPLPAVAAPSVAAGASDLSSMFNLNQGGFNQRQQAAETLRRRGFPMPGNPSSSQPSAPPPQALGQSRVSSGAGAAAAGAPAAGGLPTGTAARSGNTSSAGMPPPPAMSAAAAAAAAAVARSMGTPPSALRGDQGSHFSTAVVEPRSPLPSAGPSDPGAADGGSVAASHPPAQQAPFSAAATAPGSSEAQPVAGSMPSPPPPLPSVRETYALSTQIQGPSAAGSTTGKGSANPAEAFIKMLSVAAAGSGPPEMKGMFDEFKAWVGSMPPSIPQPTLPTEPPSQAADQPPPEAPTTTAAADAEPLRGMQVDSGVASASDTRMMDSSALTSGWDTKGMDLEAKQQSTAAAAAAAGASTVTEGAPDGGQQGDLHAPPPASPPLAAQHGVGAPPAQAHQLEPAADAGAQPSSNTAAFTETSAPALPQDQMLARLMQHMHNPDVQKLLQQALMSAEAAQGSK